MGDNRRGGRLTHSCPAATISCTYIQRLRHHVAYELAERYLMPATMQAGNYTRSPGRSTDALVGKGKEGHWTYAAHDNILAL